MRDALYEAAYKSVVRMAAAVAGLVLWSDKLEFVWTP